MKPERTLRVSDDGDEYCSCGGCVWDVKTFATCGDCRTVFRGKRPKKKTEENHERSITEHVDE
jgi:hypothetical protein